MFLYKYIFTSFTILLVLLSTSCGISSPTSSRLQREIIVKTDRPKFESVEFETVSQPNCDGNSEVENEVAKSKTIAHTIEVGEGFEVTGDGKISPAGVGIDIGAAIASNFGYQYGTAETISRAITVKAQAGTNMEHEIRQAEVWETGTVIFSVNSSLYEIPFSFRRSFIVELVKSNNLGCPNSKAGETPQSSTPAPLTAQPPLPQPIDTTAPRRGFTENDLNDLFGAGNWFCLDGFPNGVGVKNVPSVVVKFPLFAVEKQSVTYKIGEIVPAGGPATGWLQDNLPNNQCLIDTPIIGKEIVDNILGQGNWYCLSDYPTGLKVIDVPANFVVQRPLIAVDKYEVKYALGESVPGGGPATVWLNRKFPSDQCP